jgi:dipeptidyl aminopeptidase/acylaminoacyl peptidase
VSGPRALAAAAALAALGPGCIGVGFDLADLPDAPFAIVYRTREESERRVELLARGKDPALKKEDTATGEASMLRVDAAVDALGLGRTKEQKAADLLGRMAALDARTEQVQPYEFAFRGDRPLDWSRDRKRLLFASLRSDSVQLYEWSRESGEVRALTTGPLDHGTGCYLGEDRLAFSGLSRGSDGKKRVSRIYATEPGGGQPRPLTEGPNDSKPACAPDGSLVVYETLGPAGAPALGVVPGDGSAPPRIAGPGRDPAFTPDGAFVVYSTRTRAGWRLYQMHPDGEAKRPLGGGPRDEHDPRVSPDGRFVAYVYDDEGRQQLRVRTIDGRKDRPLIWNGDGVTPIW